MQTHVLVRSAIAVVCLMFAGQSSSAEIQRVTNLYDAFGAPSPGLVKDWGFAALVEYGGRRILFDTGNDAKTFETNVKALGVDLSKLDAVVISHRHGDHTSGLDFLLTVNPDVTIYTPQEGAYFKGPLPKDFSSASQACRRACSTSRAAILRAGPRAVPGRMRTSRR